MKLILTFALTLLVAGLYGCGDNTVAPDLADPAGIGPTLPAKMNAPDPGPDAEIFGFIIPSSEFPDLSFWGRECGDPGDGWMMVPERVQPDLDCGTFYYYIDGDKGCICGPPECTTSAQLNAMYQWLTRYMAHMGHVPQEG